jgi:hypothetical protein
MLRHTVGYAVGFVSLAIVLVLSMTTALVMWATRTLPLPVAQALGRREAFTEWGNGMTDRLMESVGVPLRLTGRIIRDGEGKSR